MRRPTGHPSISPNRRRLQVMVPAPLSRPDPELDPGPGTWLPAPRLGSHSRDNAPRPRTRFPAPRTMFRPRTVLLPPGQARSWPSPPSDQATPTRPDPARPDPARFRPGAAQPNPPGPAQPKHGRTPGSQRCWRPGQYPGRNRLRPVLAPGPYQTPIQCQTPTPCQAGVREDLALTRFRPDHHAWPTWVPGLSPDQPTPSDNARIRPRDLASSRGATTHTQAQHQPVVAPQHLLGGALDRSSKDRPTMSGRSHRCRSLLVDNLRVISSPVRALG